MKVTHLLVVGTLLAAVAPLRAEGDAATANEADGPTLVLCLSKPFLREASAETFQRICPVARQIEGVQIRGTAMTRGSAAIDVEEISRPGVELDAQRRAASDPSLELVLYVCGTTQTETVGQRGKVRVSTLGVTRFTAVKRIVFDGQRFVGQPTQVELSQHSQIGRIDCPGGVLRHRIVERMGRPKMERVREAGDVITRRDTLRQVCEGVDVEGGHLIALLNDLSSSVQAVARRMPGGQPLRLRVAMHGSQLLIACGRGDCDWGKGADFALADRGPVQLWIHDALGPVAVREVLDGCQRINERVRETYARRGQGQPSLGDPLAVEPRRDYLVIWVAPAALEKLQPKGEPERTPPKGLDAQWVANPKPPLDRLTSRSAPHQGGARPLDRPIERLRRTAD